MVASGTALGSGELTLGMAESTIDPGDHLVIFTDGIPEIMLKSGRQLGMRGFSRMCQNAAKGEFGNFVSGLVTEADVLRDGVPQDDDWTMVVLSRT